MPQELLILINKYNGHGLKLYRIFGELSRVNLRIAAVTTPMINNVIYLKLGKEPQCKTIPRHR